MDWKEKFLELYILGEVNAFRAALDLKREHLPQKLYRYRTVSDDSMEYRFGEIVRGELYLSHPNEFNDPFEASSHLLSSDLSIYLARKEIYKDMFVKVIEPELFLDIFESDNWFEKLMTFVAEQTVSSEKVEETKEILGKVVVHAFEELNSKISELSQKIVRIASFTTKPNNLPMWHHYSCGHKGICLEYNTNDITNVYQKNMLFPVFYVDKLPDVTHMMLHKTYPKFHLFEYMSIHKLRDWEYEDEWRLIHDVGSWFYSPENVPDDFWNNGKSIQFIRPSRVILGMNIEEMHESKIRELAKIADIPVRKAEKTEYGLKVD